MPREVTERDLRMPEFRDAKLEDLEFREDGKIVRKDRWECAIGSIRYMVGIDGREFEIPDVVEAVRKLAAHDDAWVRFYRDDPDCLPDDGYIGSIKLKDGSVLRKAVFSAAEKGWRWGPLAFTTDVTHWRDEDDDGLEVLWSAAESATGS